MNSAAAAAAAPGLSPPPISAPPAPKTSRSPQASAASSPAASAASVDVVPADADAAEGGDWNVGIQMLSAVVGCAAVGTVLWSEFVLKDTGMSCT